MVSVWGCEQRLVLGQIAANAKSNEITAVLKPLEMLSLKGCIVTAGALNCQLGIASQIAGQGGDYALALNGNQGAPNKDAPTVLDDPAAAAITLHASVHHCPPSVLAKPSGLTWPSMIHGFNPRTALDPRCHHERGSDKEPAR